MSQNLTTKHSNTTLSTIINCVHYPDKVLNFLVFRALLSVPGILAKTHVVHLQQLLQLVNTMINQMCVYRKVQGRTAVQCGKTLLTHSRGAWSSNSVLIVPGVGLVYSSGGEGVDVRPPPPAQHTKNIQ